MSAGKGPGAETRERVVRVFVSSTFRDMAAEREHLARFVFPQLRERCRARQIEFQEIDLRWGITAAQAERGETLPICLAQIYQCRPYFIGILGERYGWVPARKAIPPGLLAQQPWLTEHFERSVTELEILHGVLNNPRMSDRAFFYFRDPAYVKGVPAGRRQDFIETDPHRRAKLKALKRRILASRLRVRRDYASPGELGRLVLRDLWRSIEQEFPAISVRDELGLEAAEHEGFARERSRVYIRRRGDFDRPDAYAEQGGPPLVICGESGIGKSALLANWSLHYRHRHPEAFLVVHFIGSSLRSADYEHILRRIMEEIRRRCAIREAVPGKMHELREAFPLWLKKAGQGDGVVIVLDALNQLEDRDGAPDLGWLPERLPAGVRLILSTTEARPLVAVRRRRWPTLEIEGLDPAARRLMAEEYLGYLGKGMEQGLMESLASAPLAENPLFLKAVLEEMRVVATHGKEESCLRRYLAAPTLPALFQLILERWEGHYNGESEGLVQDSLSFLAVSRRGLSERELLELLGSPENPLPQATWSPLYLAAREFLVSRSGYLWFFHDHLRQAVEERYLAEPAARCERLLRLAEYFGDGFSRVGDRSGYRGLALDAAREAVRLAEDSENEALKAQAYLTASGVLLSVAVGVSDANADAFRECVTLVRKGCAAAARAGDRLLLAVGLRRRALDETEFNPDFGRLELIEESVRLHRRARDREGARDALLELARMGMRCDRPEVTERALREAEKINGRLRDPDPLWSAHALQHWGEHHTQQGEPERAKDYLLAARAICRKRKDQGGVCAATGWLGIAECRLGNRRHGMRLIHRAFRTEKDFLRSQEGVAKWLYWVGDWLAGAGQTRRALAALWLAELLYEEQQHSELRRTRRRLEVIAGADPGTYQKLEADFDPARGEFSRYAFLWGFSRVRRHPGGPVLQPRGATWESRAVFNPAAWTDGRTVFLLYRAEGPRARTGNKSTSVIGLAHSRDGVHFEMENRPVLEPTEPYESGGGCEDPRLVRIDGTFYLTYTAYDGKTARLAMAVSRDKALRTWEKLGPVFADEQLRTLEGFQGPRGWSKSGAILPRRVNGYYWMFFGDSHIWAAFSRDLSGWEIVGRPVLSPRPGPFFDSFLVEPGPPPMFVPDPENPREEAIWLGYNAARRTEDGSIRYAFGQALLAPYDPTRVLRRCARPLLRPEMPEEMHGRVPHVVFGEGLVRFRGRWHLYYGMADLRIGLAIAETAFE